LTTPGGPFQGIPRTGRTVEIHVINIARVANGQIVEHWNQVDRHAPVASGGGTASTSKGSKSSSTCS
jgi:hypothetical protein